VTKGLAWVLQLLTPIVTVSGARTLGSGAGAGINVLFVVVPNDLVIRMHLIGSKAGLARG
jgi:hypothetical protein